MSVNIKNWQELKKPNSLDIKPGGDGKRKATFVAEPLERGFGLTLGSPRDSSKRGSQVSFAHDHAYPLMQALIDRGVIGDFRAPETVRFGFTPLYTSFRDVWDAAEILEDILRSGAWQEPRFAVRAAVT